MEGRTDDDLVTSLFVKSEKVGRKTPEFSTLHPTGHFLSYPDLALCTLSVSQLTPDSAPPDFVLTCPEIVPELFRHLCNSAAEESGTTPYSLR